MADAQLFSIRLGCATASKTDDAISDRVRSLDEGEDEDKTPWAKTVPGTNISTCFGTSHGLVAVSLVGGSVTFLSFRRHSFSPSAAHVQQQDASGMWKDLGACHRARATAAAVCTISAEVSMDPFTGLATQEWQISARLVAEQRPLRLNLSKKIETDRRPWQFGRVVVVNRSRLLDSSLLQLVEVGPPLSALPAAFHDQEFDADSVAAAESSALDPVLTALPSRELSSWDGVLQTAALPPDFEKILIGGLAYEDGSTDSPVFAYQDCSWFVTPTIPYLEDGGSYSRTEIWARPAVLLAHNKATVPAPLSADTRWHRVDGHLVPQFEWRWNASQDVGVTQTLASQRVWNGSAHVRCAVATINITSTAIRIVADTARLLLAFGTRPGAMFVYAAKPKGSLSLDDVFGAMADGNHFAAKGNRLLWNGKAVLVASAPLKLYWVGITEVVVEVILDAQTYQSQSVTLAMAQSISSLSGPELPAELDFAAAQHLFDTEWQDWAEGDDSLGTTRFDLPSEAWTNRIDIWLAQLGIGGFVGGQLSYGAGDMYGGHYYGVEEGWIPRALASFGHNKLAAVGVEFGSSLRTVTKSAGLPVFEQYRRGLSLLYSTRQARLSGNRSWLVQQLPLWLNHSAWITAQRTGPNSSAGLLPEVIHAADLEPMALALYADMVCWRGQTELAELLHTAMPDISKTLAHEAAQYRGAIIRAACGAIRSDNLSAPFLPLALDIDFPKTKQPVNQSASSPGAINSWGLWMDMTLHAGLLQYANGSDDPWSGACKTAGQMRPGGETMTFPSTLGTNFFETHNSLWGGMPRLGRGLDVVYHGCKLTPST
jgi:hypothetical protein